MIGSVWILREGIPLLIHSEKMEPKPELKSGFFTALAHFAKAVEGQNITTIILEKKKYVYFINSLLNIAEIDIYENELLAKRLLEELAHAFINEFHEQINDHIINLAVFAPFREIISKKCSNTHFHVRCLNCHELVFSNLVEEVDEDKVLTFCGLECQNEYAYNQIPKV